MATDKNLDSIVCAQVQTSPIHAVFHAVNTPLLVLDSNFNIVDANKIREEVTGVSLKMSLGRNIFEVFPDNPGDPNADGVEKLKASLNRVLNYKIPDRMAVQKYDIPVPGKANAFEERYWRPINSPIFNSEGVVTHILHQVEDVTGQIATDDRSRIVQAANARSEIARDELYSFIMQTPSPMVILIGEEFHFLLANPAYEKFVGRKVVGKNLRDVFTADEFSHFIPLLQGVYRTGKSYIGKEVPFNIPDARGILKNHFINLGYHAFRDEKGEIKGILADVQDVTEQVEARNTLAFQSHKLETVFKESPAALALFKGPYSIFEIVNLKWTELVSHREYIGKTYVEAYPELAQSPIVGYMKNVFETGNPFHATEMEVRVESQPGILENRYYDFSYIRVLDGAEKPYGLFCHALNVTDKVLVRNAILEQKLQLQDLKIVADKARDEAQTANAAKSSFLANMSHEIRTPLGAIMGFSDLLKHSDLTKVDRVEYLNAIDRNSSQLLRVIDDILDLAKVEAGKMTIEQVDFSLIELLADFSSFMGFKARENGIQFELRAESSLPEKISSDPVRIRQILNNMIGNAIKFTEAGFVQVKVSYNDGFLNFETIDTGRGISPEQAENLFKPFAQADSSTTRKFGGTGLGLVLTKNLCETFGGDFSLIRSELGIGSTFLASLKVDLPARAFIVPADKVDFDITPPRKALDEQKRLNNLRVLLVEDSPDNQILLKIMIQKLGAEISIASDGIEGVEMALNDEFDVVLMDIQMPRQDGHAAVRELRAKDYKVPIIALTAHAMKEELIRTQESGFSGFITKPVNREELVEAILSHTNS